MERKPSLHSRTAGRQAPSPKRTTFKYLSPSKNETTTYFIYTYFPPFLHIQKDAIHTALHYGLLFTFFF